MRYLPRLLHDLLVPPSDRNFTCTQAISLSSQGTAMSYLLSTLNMIHHFDLSNSTASPLAPPSQQIFTSITPLLKTLRTTKSSICSFMSWIFHPTHHQCTCPHTCTHCFLCKHAHRHHQRQDTALSPCSFISFTSRIGVAQQGQYVLSALQQTSGLYFIKCPQLSHHYEC